MTAMKAKKAIKVPNPKRWNKKKRSQVRLLKKKIIHRRVKSSSSSTYLKPLMVKRKQLINSLRKRKPFG